MKNFTELNLKPAVLKRLKEIEFIEPTAIQQKVIPLILENKGDIIGLAQTGTGKTAAFALPILSLIDLRKKHPQALVIAPTRELTMQITADFQTFAAHLKGMNIVSVYGGAGIEGQIQSIKKGAQIIVATPGRLADLLRRRKVDLNSIEYLVLDEADEMLNIGFKEELDSILSQTPAEKISLLLSATMSKEVARIAGEYMREPLEVTAGEKNAGHENIEHRYYVVNSRDKYKAMRRIVDAYPDIYAIVFCRTRNETRDIAESLMKDGYNADAIHGELSQAQRARVMKRFRDRNLQILVATDVAARGIDVKDISHVIHYSLPDEAEVFTHRSGRTARAGNTGISLAIIHKREVRKLQHIQNATARHFTYHRVPDAESILMQHAQNFIEKLKSDDETVSRNKALNNIAETAVEELSDLKKDELIRRIIRAEMQPLLRSSESAGAHADLNVDFSGMKKSDAKKKRKETKDNSRQKRAEKPNETTPRKKKTEKKAATVIENKNENKGTTAPPVPEGKSRFFINSGSKYGMTPQNLRDYIETETGIRRDGITSIEIMKKFAFFEVKEKNSSVVLEKIGSSRFNERDVTVQPAVPAEEK